MVEAGDTVSATLKKEFGEEALNSLEATDEEKRKIEEHINHLFKSGDKAWIRFLWETTILYRIIFPHVYQSTVCIYILGFSAIPVIRCEFLYSTNILPQDASLSVLSLWIRYFTIKFCLPNVRSCMQGM